jgi:transposase
VPLERKRKAALLCTLTMGKPNYTAIGKEVGLHRKVVARAHKNLRQFASVVAPKAPPPSYTEEDIALVYRLVSMMPSSTYEEIMDAVELKEGKRLSKRVLGKIYAEIGFSRKIMTLVSTRRCFRQGERWFEQIRGLSRSRFVFVDEVGTNSRTGNRKYGYGIGPVYARGVLHKGLRCSTVAAISLEGHIVQRSKAGSIKALDFYGFVIEDLLPRIPDNSIIVWDNCRVHPASLNDDYRLQMRGISVMALPPYSPHLNPIELMFRSLKAYLKRTREAGYALAIQNVLQAVTREQCAAWFAESFYWRPLNGRMPLEAYKCYPLN